MIVYVGLRLLRKKELKAALIRLMSFSFLVLSHVLVLIYPMSGELALISIERTFDLRSLSMIYTKLVDLVQIENKGVYEA